MDKLVLLNAEEQKLRIEKVRQAMAELGLKSAIISSAANIFYLTGRVFAGYVYLPADGSDPIYFVKRPVHLLAERSISIRKPEGILPELQVRQWPMPESMGLELSHLRYTEALRLMAALGLEPGSVGNASTALAIARSVKTPLEISLMRASGAKHERVYRKIGQIFSLGMSDIELQIEIERISRLEGCLGQFRVNGDDMEIYMGNVLAGNNADSPSPYDFAMGGAGLDPSLPVGADGTIIKPGMTVMVDMNGNFTGYMTDMTRTFALGRIDERARYAHQVSIDICRELAAMGKPGVEAKALYEKAIAIAQEADLSEFFMGHTQHAGFVGHGVGIEINELPVIAPRSKSVLAEGNTIALEPKFVIPSTGAVGIENTYVVTPDGMECLTHAPQELIQLDR